MEATRTLSRASTDREAAGMTADLVMELLRADRVQVMVAEGEGSSRFVSRGQRNIPLPLGRAVVDADTEPTGTGRAVRTGETLFVADCPSSPMVSPHLARLILAASAAFIPLPGEGGFLGAVVVLWDTPRAGLDRFSQRAVEVLSAEAGRALERTRADARLARDLGRAGGRWPSFAGNGRFSSSSSGWRWRPTRPAPWKRRSSGPSAKSAPIPPSRSATPTCPTRRGFWRQAAAWQVEHGHERRLHLSVNLSARQLQDPHLVQDIEQILGVCGLDPTSLVIEITESVLMSEPDVAIQKLRLLKELGVHLAIDDFGTGYSSLSYLRRLPVDILKIDRSFVAGLGGRPEDAALPHAIVKLGHTLDLRVVAEGIETSEQFSELRALGCAYGQGYLFAPPLTADDMAAVLKDPRRSVALLHEPTSETS